MEQLKHPLQVGETVKALMDYGDQVLPPLLARRLGEPTTWKTSSWQDRLTPKWNGAHLLTQTTYSALKLQGITPWVDHIRVRRALEPQTLERQPGATDPLDYLCDPLSDLKLLF